MLLDEMQFCTNADFKEQEHLQEKQGGRRKTLLPQVGRNVPGLPRLRDLGAPLLSWGCSGDMVPGEEFKGSTHSSHLQWKKVLPDVANENAGHSVIFEFPMNSKYIFSMSMSYVIFGTHLH